MTAATYVPPNVLPAAACRNSRRCLSANGFASWCLLPPTITRRRFSNKTEDYGVFKPSPDRRTSDNSRSMCRTSSARAAGTKCWPACATAAPASRSRIRIKPGWTIRCCYMSAAAHDECLVLVEERDPDGKLTVPSGMSFFHTAFELEGNRLEDVFAFADQAKTGRLRPQLRAGAPQRRAAARRRRNRRQRRLLFLRSRLQQRRILRRDGHDRELSRALWRHQRFGAGVTGKFHAKVREQAIVARKGLTAFISFFIIGSTVVCPCSPGQDCGARQDYDLVENEIAGGT